MSGPVTLDGFSDEDAWRRIEPLAVTLYEPTYLGDATERTEVRIAHDGQHLWIAGRLYDSAPLAVRTNSLRRDRPGGGDEFGIVVDPLGTNESALHLYTNPAGVRFDQAIANDAESGFGQSAFNPDWNTFWDVVTGQTNEGWFVEMRVPFSSLGLRPINNHAIIGLTVYRYIARKNERQTTPAIPPNWTNGYLKPSRTQSVVLSGIRARRPVYVTPYWKAGFNKTSQPNGANGVVTNYDDINDLGVDAKLIVRDAMTLDLSVNTDFAEVESDDQRVNLTRFPLFFPEKRQFFQERASLFEFRTGDFDRAFHSRRIGLNGGEPVPLLFGARLVGRIGAWDLGALEIVDRSREGLLGVSHGVVRVRRQVINPYSLAGAILTTRHGDGAQNVAGGFDAVVRIKGLTYFTAQAIGTSDRSGMGTTRTALSSSLLRLRFERRGRLGWLYQADVRRIGQDYKPDLGFVERRGVVRANLVLGRGWSGGSDSWVRTFWPNFVVLRTIFRNDDRSLESAFLAHIFNVDARDGSRTWFGIRTAYESLRDTLQLPEGAFAPPGQYTFPALMAGHVTGRTRQYSIGTWANVGAFYDGWRVSANVEPTWNVSPHLELSGQYLVDFIRFNKRQQRFWSHIVRLRLVAAVDARRSAQILLQTNSTARLVTPSIRLRYNFREGSDLWLVYDEVLNLDRARTQPLLPLSGQRALILKLTHTLKR